MTTDLTMLAWTAAFTSLLWIPYILARMQKVGAMKTLTYVADDEPLPGWAQRAKRAHYNAIESLAPFAAVVIVAHLTGAANVATAVWSTIYFWARVAHYFGHISGLPFVRTTFFAVGWIAILVIFWHIVV